MPEAGIPSVEHVSVNNKKGLKLSYCDHRYVSRLYHCIALIPNTDVVSASGTADVPTLYQHRDVIYQLREIYSAKSRCYFDSVSFI